jgi:peptidyl-prolyl cis-trans isomerase SurA
VAWAVAAAWTAGVALPTEDAPDRILLDGYAAMVNDRVITVGEVLLAAAPLDQQARLGAAGPDEYSRRLNENYRMALDRMIERALMVEEVNRRVADRPELRLPDRAVEDQLLGTIRDRFDGRRDLLIEALAEEGLSLDEYRRQLRERTDIFRLMKEEVGDRLLVSPGRVREEYERRKAEFETPEEIRLRMIMFPRGADEASVAIKRELADRALARLAAGEAFEAVARAMSEGFRADAGGDLGWVRPTELRPELRDAIAGLRAGEASGVIEAEDGWYLVQVAARREAGLRAYEEVRSELEQDLALKEQERLTAEWVARLRTRHFCPRASAGAAGHPMTTRPIVRRIAVTIGDPNGIGPEVALRACAQAVAAGLPAEWVLVGGPRAWPPPRP